MRHSARIAAGMTVLAGVALTSAALTSAGPASAVPTAPTATTQTYIVVLRQAPAASYTGGIGHFARTEPTRGHRFDDSRASVAAYRGHLLQGQHRLLASIGNPPVLYSYTTALDGFAAKLSTGQVERLATSPRVLEVRRDSLVQPNGLATPGHRPSTRAGTPASARPTETGGGDEDASDAVAGSGHGGRGIVIGVVDSGVWPSNPSLAGIPLGADTLRRDYPGFTGSCQVGDRWTKRACDSKVVAARYFVRGFEAAHVASSDFLSPRDGLGHGTSVAAQAAGNPGIAASIGQHAFGLISGVAPQAALSVYKACWTAPEPAGDGCDTADTLAAVDQAVADGVDVLEYALGGTSTSVSSPVELAFLNAAAANVFVATSAGNDGPRPGTVAHPSPWVTTVGANTHGVFQGGLRLGDGAEYIGAMLSDRSVGPTKIVYAGSAPAPGVSNQRAALCYPGSLAATAVDGATVVCDRGVIARVSKGAAVAQAGGAAMVLVNTAAPQEIDADQQSVPTVHLDARAGAAVKAYVKQAGGRATATLVAAATNHPAVPQVAEFSSRGPSAALSGDVLKPDVTAPGVTVAAAVAPASDGGRRWDVESGTSLSAAYVAGAAADVESAHPTWSPAMVKSALMTTATPLRGRDVSPLVRGAGQVDPVAAADPGLVYENGMSGWSALLAERGVRLPGSGPVSDVTDPTELNLPSIAIGDLVGQVAVTRRVTNVGAHPATYQATLRGLPGIARSVSPASLTLRPGQSGRFALTLAATKTARYDTFSTGSISWSDGSGPGAGHVVTSPIVVRPELARVPGAISASGAQGSVRIKALAGVTGTLHAATTGLVGATPVPLTLQPTSFDPNHPETSAGAAEQTLQVPADSVAARFQVTAGRNDRVAIYVYRDSTRVGATAGTEAATITLRAPDPGTYRVYVTSPRSGAGTTTRAAFTTWVVPRHAAEPLSLGPPSLDVVGGEPFSVQASWSGLSRSQRWFGLVTYEGLPTTTFLTIN